MACIRSLRSSTCLRSVSKNLTKDEQSKISLNSTIYNFLVDHSSFEKDILNTIFPLISAAPLVIYIEIVASL